MIDYTETITRNLTYYKIDSSNAILNPSEEYAYQNDDEAEAIKKIFLRPFSSVTTTLEFHHEVDLNLNVLYSLTKLIHEGSNFLDQTFNIYKHLIASSKHPNIKNGDLFVIKYDDIKLANKFYEAVGIYKVENKESFIETSEKGDKLAFKKGIGPRRLDKACLIIFTEETYTILIIDNNNSETDYWQNEFIKVRLRNDSVNNTSQLLTVAKKYITEQLPNEFEVTKADKIDLLNRSMKYFKENESFDMKEFGNEVIGNDQGIASFLKYKQNYENEFETPIPDSFDINSAAVKKQGRVYKSVLKLDKNFHIYIHGDKELIEKGFDDEKGMSFYKVFFREEN